MKHSKYIIISGLFFIFMFSSCQHSLNFGYNLAGNFKKEDSYFKIMDSLNVEPMLEKVVLSKISNENFKVVIFKRLIQRGDFFVNIDVYDLFVLSFKNEKLYYWGDIDDYKRSNNKIINELGMLSSEIWIND